MILHLTPFIALIFLVGALDLEEESYCTCGHPIKGIDFGGPRSIEGLKNSASENTKFSMVLNSINDPRFTNLMKYHGNSMQEFMFFFIHLQQSC